MKLYYFIIKNDKKEGPYLYEDLIKMTLSENDDVWRSDKEKWVKIGELEEFKNFQIASPPPTPNELKKEDDFFRNQYFQKVLIKKSLYYYIIFCFILTLARHYFAINSYESEKGNSYRYEYVFQNQLNNTETMYGNQQDFLFRGVKFQTVYLSSEEQSSYLNLFFNLFMSNLISLSLIYFIVLIYLYKLVMKVRIE